MDDLLFPSSIPPYSHLIIFEEEVPSDWIDQLVGSFELTLAAIIGTQIQQIQ